AAAREAKARIGHAVAIIPAPYVEAQGEVGVVGEVRATPPAPTAHGDDFATDDAEAVAAALLLLTGRPMLRLVATVAHRSEISAQMARKSPADDEAAVAAPALLLAA